MENIFYATAYGYIEAVRDFLDGGVDVNAKDMEDIGGRTALHLAAERGYLEIVRLLVARGANIEAQNEHEETPLHEAVVHGETEIADFLIYCGADFRRTFNQDRSLLHVAAIHNSVEVAEALIRHRLDIASRDDKNCTPLHVAATWNNRETADLLIQHGAEVDVWVAAGLCDEQMARLLLVFGEDINALGDFDDTPLKLAKMRGSKDVIQRLQERLP